MIPPPAGPRPHPCGGWRGGRLQQHPDGNLGPGRRPVERAELRDAIAGPELRDVGRAIGSSVHVSLGQERFWFPATSGPGEVTASPGRFASRDTPKAEEDPS